MPSGLLTPKPGYVVTLSQSVGERPRLRAECTRCPDEIPVPALDVGMSEAELTIAVRVALSLALGHASSHISDSEGVYPHE